MAGPRAPRAGGKDLYWLLGIAGCLYGVAEQIGHPLPLPTASGSVPQSWWRKWGRMRASAAYGFWLGIGVTAVIRFPAFHVLLAWSVLRGDASVAAMVFFAYALGRSLPVLVAAIPAATGVAATRITDLYLGPGRGLHRLNGSLLTLFSLWLLTAR